VLDLVLVFTLSKVFFKSSKNPSNSITGDDNPNKTWCYWAEQPLRFILNQNPVVSWKKLMLSRIMLTINQDLGKGYPISHISSKRFLSKYPFPNPKFKNITLIQRGLLK